MNPIINPVINTYLNVFLKPRTYMSVTMEIKMGIHIIVQLGCFVKPTISVNTMAASFRVGSIIVR